MKKSLKIVLASTIAAVGVAASFGGAFALYTQSANPAEFSIGAYTHTSKGTVTYAAGSVTSSLGENKISPDNPTVEYKIPLGGSYSNDIPAQDFIYGNLKVDITIPTEIANTTRWCVYVDGYNDGSYWDTNFDTLRRLTGPKVDDKDPIVGETTSVNKDIAVNAVASPTAVARPSEHANVANQWVVVYVNFSEALTASNFKNFAEKAFKIDVTFDKVSATCARPQVFGDGNSWNKEAYEYGLVPNIAANKWEWEFKDLSGFGQLLLYVKEGSNERYVKDTNGNNLTVDPSKTYQVYVNGIDGVGDKNSLYTETVETINYIKG